MVFNNKAGLCAALLVAVLNGCAAVSEPAAPADISPRPLLGVRLRVTPADDVPPALAAGQQQVLTVVHVREQLAAEQAGIRPGDVLLALDGVPVTGMRDSLAVMQAKRWGESVDITLYRDREIQHVQAVMAAPWGDRDRVRGE